LEGLEGGGGKIEQSSKLILGSRDRTKMRTANSHLERGINGKRRSPGAPAFGVVLGVCLPKTEIYRSPKRLKRENKRWRG